MTFIFYIFTTSFGLFVDLIKWFAIKKNREVSLKYFRIGLGVGKKVASYTKTKKDDKGLEYVIQTLDAVTKNMSESEKTAIARAIDEEKKGVLSDLNVSYNSNGKVEIELFGFKL